MLLPRSDRGMTTRGLRAPLLFVLLAGFTGLAAMLQALPVVAASASVPGKLQAWKGGATPALVLRDALGAAQRLADRRGKVVLVNFWATWCEPCRAEMPSLLRARAQLGDALEVLAVNLGESPQKVEDFLKTLEGGTAGLTVLFDHDMSVARAWKANLAPATFVIRPDGRIAWSLLGEADWASPDMLKLLASLASTAGNPVPASNTAPAGKPPAGKPDSRKS